MPSEPAADDVPLERGTAQLLQFALDAKARGAHAQGTRWADECARIAQEEGDVVVLAQALSLGCLHHLRVGALEESMRSGRRAETLLKASGAEAALAELLSTLSCVMLQAGLHHQALAYGMAARQAAQTAGDRRGECWALNRIGCAFGELGEWQRAIASLDLSLDIARSLGGHEEVFAAINNLSETHWARAVQQRAQGADAQAAQAAGLALAYEACAMCAGTGFPHREAVARLNLGKLLHDVGRDGEAREVLERLAALAREHGFRGLLRAGAVESAAVAWNLEQDERALARLESLLASVDLDDKDRWQPRACGLLHGMYKQVGNFERALHFHERLHDLTIAATARRETLQARLLVHEEDLAVARETVERAAREAVLQRMRVEELDRAAHQDALTGLFNRRFLVQRMPQLMARAQESGQPLSLAMVDIDHFKYVNDEHGHATGDRVLTHVGALIRDATRAGDLSVRLGGEEFCVVLMDVGLKGALEACERLRQSVQAHAWCTVQSGLSLTVSLGLCDWSAGQSLDDLLQHADEALYASKNGGRNRVTVRTGR